MRAKRLTLCGLVLGLLSGFTVAQEKTHCSLVEDHQKRTSCYSKSAAKPQKDWLVLKSRYFKSVTVSKSAIREVQCADKVGSTSIVFICADKQPRLTITTSCAMGKKSDPKDVIVSIDDQAPKTESFVVPNNKFALDTNDKDLVVRLTKSLLGHKRLHMRMAPATGEPYTATFDISKLKNKIKPLRTACGW